MQTSSGQIIRMKRALSLCFVALVIVFTGESTSAQVNSWTSGSGNWDEPSSWSLGVLPNSLQSVMITNSGWKAVAINPSTPINFPNSMTVGSLTIRGATNTENTLLLNFFGTAVPLTVLNGLTLADDAHILNFNSGLVVQGGTIVVTNSQIIQDGGFVRTTNVTMNFSGAEYHLTNGVFEAGVVQIGAPIASRFNQYGGDAVIAHLNLGPRSPGSGSRGGTYALYGGNLTLPNGLTLLGDNGSLAAYFQAGGTNRTPEVFIEPGLFGISPSFKLNGGLLAASNVSVLADNFGSATLEQNGGTHTVSNLLHIAGGASAGASPKPGAYHLNGGTLSAHSIDLDALQGDASFVQTNGNVQTAEFEAHSGINQPYFVSRLFLSGGTLASSNLSVADGGSIQQNGGALVVSNTLGILGFRNPGVKLYTRYTFTGGTLSASNIYVSGDWIIGDSATPRITNPGTCVLSHFLQISNAVEELGRFILASNATIDLAGSASQLSFADSSGETWDAAATLVVLNWNGNLSGGGAEQLRFGTDSSGLTPAQLSQIRFSTTTSTNLYSAKILNTGEVVPDQAISSSVAFSTQGNNLVLTWPPGWTLQTATNVPGPYFDVPGATSPHTNDMTLDQQRFFRLRQ